MPTQTSAVGALTLPIPAAGDATTALADPIAAAVLDFLAWSLNNDLNTRLTELAGTTATAVPAANPVGDFRSNLDFFEPQGPHIRMRTPALHVWWDGNSTSWSPSALQKGVQRDLQLLYIFDELPPVAETFRRAGLFAAVNASLAKASERGYHPLYSYNSMPLGTRLEDSIGDFATWEWEYLGGRGIKRIGIDDPNTTQLGIKVSGRDRPAVAGLVRIRELIQPPQTETPGDLLTDGEVRLLNDGVEILDRTLEPDDGDCARP